MAVKIYICKQCNTEQRRLKIKKELQCENCGSSELEDMNKLNFINNTNNFSKSKAELVKEKILKTLHRNIKDEYFDM